MRKQISNWGNYPVIEADEESFSYPEQLIELISKRKGFIPGVMADVMETLPWHIIPFQHLNSIRFFRLIN